MLFKQLTPPTKKILTIILILNILAFLVYAILFYQIKKKNEFYSVSKTKLNYKTGQNNEFRLMKKTLDETKDKRNQINSYFISKEESGMVSFIESLELASRSDGLSLKVNSISLRNRVEEGLQDTKIDLRIKGSWAGIVRFINFLETMPYKIDFERISLLKSDEGTSHSTEWDGIFRLSILKLKK